VTDAPAIAIDRAATRRRSEVATGFGAGAATFAFLLLGINRAYDLDESLTVGLFVATPDIGDAFTRSPPYYVLNNHAFFSFLDHLVYTVGGSDREAALRALPILFVAAAVGLLAFLLARRFGALAAAAGAAVLATNPTFAAVGSQVRGYSLVALVTVATTAILLDAIHDDEPSVGRRVAYAVLAALGVATHLYMVVVIGVHVVLAGGKRRIWEAWVPAWLASALGLAAYAWLWRDMRAAADASGRHFRLGFPYDLTGMLLGGSVVAAALLFVLVGPVVWQARHVPLIRRGALGIAGAALAVWVVAPFDLYPRFFLWLVPLVAVGVAAAVASRRAVLVLVALVVVAQLWVAWPRLTADPYASRTVRDAFARVRADGGRPCALNAFTSLRLVAYTSAFSVPTRPAGLRSCAVVATLATAPGSRSRWERAADAEFPYRVTLDARDNGVLWSRLPAGCWLEDRSPGLCISTSP
jgi:hypothetical protein